MLLTVYVCFDHDFWEGKICTFTYDLHNITTISKLQYIYIFFFSFIIVKQKKK